MGRALIAIIRLAHSTGVQYFLSWILASLSNLVICAVSICLQEPANIMIVIFGLFGGLGIGTWIVLLPGILFGSLWAGRILSSDLAIATDFTFSSFWLLRWVQVGAWLLQCLRSIARICCQRTGKPFILLSAVGILTRSLGHNALNLEITVAYLAALADHTSDAYNICRA